ncbi:unnamed protein product [Brassicogethes aeneus]|uniref:SKICH domain-containing protein n=1 Tax=Brassicogethes aeneus TaxID=1431903 RepID=A0A9P0FNK6_BRAAE|nr:unnamed protein product [Brassicogethes aeneus]
MDSDSFVSMKHNVEFPSINDQYSCGEDLIVSFKFAEYMPQDGDRIAIFKLGWSSVRDYVCFEWAPTKLIGNLSSVVFKKDVLPKSLTDMYQICYISRENELHGASSPFQVGSNFTNPMTCSLESNKKSLIIIEKNKDEEIQRLREENHMLVEALKLVVRQEKRYEQDIKSLKIVIDRLSNGITNQQQEINLIKAKVFDNDQNKIVNNLESLKIQNESKIIKDNLDLGDLKSIPPFPFS